MVCARLMEFRIFKFFKSSRFSNSDFFKAPVPARSNETFPTNYFFKKPSFPAVFAPRNGNGGMFFYKWRVATELMGFQVKDFVSERTSNPSPMCLRGATPTKSMSGACGVFFTRSNLESTMMPYQNKVQWDENETAGAEAQINIASKIIDNDNEPEVDSE